MVPTPAPHVPLNVLDLVPISDGSGVREALDASTEAAQVADRAGYLRYWFAEHHNTESLAASATSLLIGHAAGATERIRVGSGGIMLPNHSPLVVAEQFGTLAQLYPDRIDLGLGRAPGTDRLTAQLLSRTSAEPQAFAQAIYEMQGWMGESGQAATYPIGTAVAQGTNVPMWVLGSTANGAAIAGQLGLPFSVASHFQPDGYLEALEVYRSTFTTESPTAQIEQPRVMVGVNVVVADTDEEARHQYSTVEQMFVGIRTGQRGKLPAPRQLETSTVDPLHLSAARDSLRVTAVGSPATVVEQLEDIVRTTQADELIAVSYFHDPADRIRSLELLAEAWRPEG